MRTQYLTTERAHFMCPNMHFGVLFEMNVKYDLNSVSSTLGRLADAHPFLKSVIAYEDGSERLYYKVTDASQITLTAVEDEAALWKAYESISRQSWNVFTSGLLRVFVCPHENRLSVLFAAHHLLADGRGLMGLATEFADDYSGKGAPAYAEEQLIEDIADLPSGSRLAGISRLLIKRANKQWMKENHAVSYERYLAFEEEYLKSHNVEHHTYEIAAPEVAKMLDSCKENGFTVNDLLMAHMYIKTGTRKIIIAADVRKQFARYRNGALGNYATAAGIICRTKTADVTNKAKEVHSLVQKHMKDNRRAMLVLACYFDIEPTLLDAAAISSLGGFQSKAGSFVGVSMFSFGKPTSYSITNLGRVENDAMSSLMFIPPASPAAKLTLGVVTLNGTLRACSSVNTV